jgi:hypothetical protein
LPTTDADLEAQKKRNAETFKLITHSTKTFEATRLYAEFLSNIEKLHYLENITMAKETKQLCQKIDINYLPNKDTVKIQIENFNLFYEKLIKYYDTKKNKCLFSNTQLLIKRQDNNGQDCDIIYYLLAYQSMQKYLSDLKDNRKTYQDFELAKEEIHKYSFLTRIYGLKYLKYIATIQPHQNLKELFIELRNHTQQKPELLNVDKIKSLELIATAFLIIAKLYWYLCSKYENYAQKKSQTYIPSTELNKLTRLKDFLELIFGISLGNTKELNRDKILQEAKDKNLTSKKTLFVFSSTQIYLDYKLELVAFSEIYGMESTKEAAHVFCNFINNQYLQDASLVHKMFKPVFSAIAAKYTNTRASAAAPHPKRQDDNSEKLSKESENKENYQDFKCALDGYHFALDGYHLMDISQLKRLKNQAKQVNIELLDSPEEKKEIEKFNAFYARLEKYYDFVRGQCFFSNAILLQKRYDNNGQDCDIIYFILAAQTLQQHCTLVVAQQEEGIILSKYECYKYYALAKIYGFSYTHFFQFESTYEADFSDLFISLEQYIHKENILLNTSKEGIDSLDWLTMSLIEIARIYWQLHDKYLQFKINNKDKNHITENETNKWNRFKDFIDFINLLKIPDRQESLEEKILQEAKEKGFASTTKFGGLHKSTEFYLQGKLAVLRLEKRIGTKPTEQAATVFFNFLKVQDQSPTSNVYLMFHKIFESNLQANTKNASDAAEPLSANSSEFGL